MKLNKFIPDLDFLTVGLRKKSLKKFDTRIPNRDFAFTAPGQDSAEHNGFVNCTHNQNGLQAKFFREDDGNIACVWTRTKKDFEGYPGLIHGGVASSLVDELMGNAVLNKCNRFGVTLTLRTYFHGPIQVGDEVYGRCYVEWNKDEKVKCQAHLFKGNGRVLLSGVGAFFLPNAAQFKSIAKLKEVPEEILPYFGQ